MRAHLALSLFVFASAAGCSSTDAVTGDGTQAAGPSGNGTVVAAGASAGSAGVTAVPGMTQGGQAAVAGSVSAAGGTSTPAGAQAAGTAGGGSVVTNPVAGASGAGGVGGAGGAGGVPVTGGGGTSAAGDTGVGGAAPVDVFEYPAPVNPWQPSQACRDTAAQILSGLTQAQKAGQMVQGNTTDMPPSDVTTYQLGSAFSGGSADPPTDDTPQSWRAHVESYEQAVAGSIPLIYGIDAVHGHNNVSNAVIFPHNIGLGCTRDPALLREVGRITAREMRGTSIDWTFAPAISPARDERWGRIFESYSEDPALTAQLAVALVQGLQGDSLGGPESVLACAKHFAGDGATEGGVDQGDVNLDDATFRRLGVEVYQPLINAGVGNIMVSYSSVNGVKMTENKVWLTDVLKGEMGFQGFLSSDWAASGQLSGGTLEVQVANAINAGLDMLMEPYAWADVVQIIEAAPNAGGNANIPQARIDDAVTRVLTIKCELGMFEPGYDPSGDAPLLAEIGSEAHRDVARQAVRESAVLLKNDGALPIPLTAKVHVAGEGADSLQRQCGGWTIDWQGLGVTSADRTPGVTTGTTILQGIQNMIGAQNVTYSQNASGIPADATHVIVVVSEAPYAEGNGDETDIDMGARTNDVPVLATASASGLPVIVVIISGRPLIIEPYLDQADAWLAAWLPGTEADALADVLFGVYPPTGVLGHSWPRTNAQLPINVGDADYESDPPLFPFGYGLSY